MVHSNLEMTPAVPFSTAIFVDVPDHLKQNKRLKYKPLYPVASWQMQTSERGGLGALRRPAAGFSAPVRFRSLRLAKRWRV
jgi:hypothetical protein